jgi:hypothetical protein
MITQPEDIISQVMAQPVTFEAVGQFVGKDSVHVENPGNIFRCVWIKGKVLRVD